MKRITVDSDFWDLDKIEVGTIVYDTVLENQYILNSKLGSFRLIILRGPIAWCCYIGIYLDHPLANKSYDDDIFYSFHCHGGLTFAGSGDDTYLPLGWFFYGWDYGHGGDYIAQFGRHFGYSTDKKWTFGELKKDIEDSLESFREIVTKYINDMVKIKPELNYPKREYSRKRKRLIRID